LATARGPPPLASFGMVIICAAAVMDFPAPLRPCTSATEPGPEARARGVDLGRCHDARRVVAERALLNSQGRKKWKGEKVEKWKK
jgi:hypothetical protein